MQIDACRIFTRRYSIKRSEMSTVKKTLASKKPTAVGVGATTLGLGAVAVAARIRQNRKKRNQELKKEIEAQDDTEYTNDDEVNFDIKKHKYKLQSSDFKQEYQAAIDNEKGTFFDNGCLAAFKTFGNMPYDVFKSFTSVCNQLRTPADTYGFFPDNNPMFLFSDKNDQIFFDHLVTKDADYYYDCVTFGALNFIEQEHFKEMITSPKAPRLVDTFIAFEDDDQLLTFRPRQRDNTIYDRKAYGVALEYREPLVHPIINCKLDLTHQFNDPKYVLYIQAFDMSPDESNEDTVDEYNSDDANAPNLFANVESDPGEFSDDDDIDRTPLRRNSVYNLNPKRLFSKPKSAFADLC